jgi:primosomal protein N' (replication factor Y)
MESKLRSELGYPPHGRLLRVVIDSEDPALVVDAAKTVGELMRRHAQPGGMVLGPAEAPVALLRGRHRRHVLLKAKPGTDAIARVRAGLRAFTLPNHKLRMSIDVDPMSML